jgi:hypothetical protein
MEQLEQTLLPHLQAGSHRRNILVLHGLGGIGKTQLAVEFSRKHEARFTSVFWLDGSSENNLKQSIVICASRISGSQNTERIAEHNSHPNNLDTAINGFMGWLSIAENNRWLIVFDNVDRDYQQKEIDRDAYDISDYLPDADHGSILITTRLATLKQLGVPVHLRSVETNCSRAIFRKWYGEDFGTALVAPATDSTAQQ